MGTGAEEPASEMPGAWLQRHWRWLVALFWLGACAFMLWERWSGIRWFALSDTDDNLRIAQVRALLEGQGWYDLRQYRMNPPFGADVHWSRIPDLPIAALKLIFQPWLGGARAEQIAVAVAPMLPMAAAMTAVALTVRRLVHPLAFLLGLAILVCAVSTRSMWMPLRIDHHGWQLAMLAIVVAGLVDPKRLRGGVTVGIATAISLSIGMEMLIYLALAGGIIGLMWVRDDAERVRLAGYGASLAGGTALGFLLFASEANRQPVCDALSPVWLSAMAAAGVLCVLLAAVGPRSVWARFAAAALAGAVLAAGFALLWPHCLGRLEQSSPELEQLWLSKVREAMPIYRHTTQTMVSVLTLPVIGLLGYAQMLWRARGDSERLIPWAAVALLALAAFGLLFWQTRASPAAQLLAVPGAAGLGWIVIVWARASRSVLVRVGGPVAAFAVVPGLVGLWSTQWFAQPSNPRRQVVDIANRRCPTLGALNAVARQTPGTVLTFVDLGPRIISVTPHNALAGPYHRNGAQIIDVQRSWRGTAENALATVRRYRVDYVLICPNLSESTIYSAEAPQGFYVQLTRGQVPTWLSPVPLPANSPYRMWRVVR